MMEKVVFETGWESFFASRQLQRFEDFFYYGQGQTINYNNKRNVVALELEDNGRRRIFYMKRFVHPHIKDMLSALYHYVAVCSQAELEWRNAHMLLSHGIETYHPVCYGVQSFFGIERQSFFITEEINGSCLLDYLKGYWALLGQEKRNGLMVRLGTFFAHIHARRIRLPDSYIWHVYRVESAAEADEFELAMIDLHRMEIRKRDLRSAAKDLGAFLFSFPDGVLTGPLRSLFLQTYLQGSGIANQEAFCKRVGQWEQKIASRRKRPLVRLQSPQTDSIE
jgi:hypothetical protein